MYNWFILSISDELEARVHVITFLLLSRHFLFSNSHVLISVKMAALCWSRQRSRSCNYYPVRNYRISNKHKNIVCVCVCVCVLACVVGCCKYLAFDRLQVFFHSYFGLDFHELCMSGKRRIYKHVCGGDCLRLDSIYFSRSTFILVSDYGTLYFVLFIRNLFLICKIILTECAALHHRYNTERNHTQSDYNGWVIFFCNAWICSKMNNLLNAM